MRKSNSIQKKKHEQLTTKIQPTSSLPNNSMLDSLKQGFGFGVGSEIGRKGIDAITNTFSRDETIVDKNCDNVQEDYIHCIREYQMIHFCEEKYNLYENCKKQYMK